MSRIAWIAIIVVGAVVVCLLALGVAVLFPLMSRQLSGVMPGLGGTLPRGFGGGMMRPGLVFGFGLPFLLLRGFGMLLFWVLVIGAVILLWRGLTHTPVTTTGTVMASETPLDILKRRYAKGEISKEQFEEMKSALGA